MSSENALENAEDLEIVPVARLEDIQPRGRSSESYDEVIETFVIDDTYESFVEDEDSNIGSMVSIQSEEVVECEDQVECEDEGAELIVPELLEPAEKVATETKKHQKPDASVPSKQNRPDSWPTLEILPGGVINSTDKNDVTNLYPNVVDRDAMEEPGDMMYACAKCSQSFKYLFCLVKHVKWHEDEAKKAKQGPDLSKLNAIIEQQDGLIQLDFANKYLGGGVLGSGCVQEEIRFVISPELLLSMLFTEELEPNEALMMIGSELYSEYSGYGSSFAWKGDHKDGTPFDACGRRRNAVLAIDACPFYDRTLEYSQKGLVRELNKAWVGFSFFTRENSEGLNYPGVATGNWGCGAFGGSPQLKSLIQLMACAEARRPIAYFTFGNAEFTDELYEIYELLVRKNVTVGQLYQHILNFAKEDEHLEELFAYLHKVVNYKAKSSMI